MMLLLRCVLISIIININVDIMIDIINYYELL